jgi:spectinomycin phosphotransferase
VRALPEDVETGALIAVLADDWGFDTESAEYAAVGAGSYHWVVTDREGMRAFVTVDDLDWKHWLGDTRDSAFEGLRRAFDTAVALRDGGLEFVVAPIPTRGGETVRRIGPRHTIALFPLVAGEAGRFGHYDTAERAGVVKILARLHRATPTVASVANTYALDLPGRPRLEASLREVSRTWVGGPFSEPARQALARHASDVVELLALADRLAAALARRRDTWVVTHGEPHAGNVMRAGEDRLLVDWDTVALGPPERDLWMVVGDGADEATIYAEATGHQLDQMAVDFFRLAWDIEDLAGYVNVLRSPHRHSEDTVKAYEAVLYCVKSRDRWAALLGETVPVSGSEPSRM